MYPKRNLIAAIDFDHTIWDTPNNQPLPQAREALSIIRERGIKIVIHSCNNKSWIEKCLSHADIRFDWIWDQQGKPIADIYIDDCGFSFAGDWTKALPAILKQLEVGNAMISDEEGLIL